MKEYTKRDQSKYGDMNIAKVAYPKFQEKLQVCKDLLHGFRFQRICWRFSAYNGKTYYWWCELCILDASVTGKKGSVFKGSYAFEAVTFALL